MKQIGTCKDRKGNVSPLFEENGKHYRRNPPAKIIDGNQDHSNQTIGGDIYIKGLKQGDKKLQKHLDEFYKTKQEKYTWATFFEWITKGD